jgi:hypothetical protein
MISTSAKAEISLTQSGWTGRSFTVYCTSSQPSPMNFHSITPLSSGNRFFLCWASSCRHSTSCFASFERVEMATPSWVTLHYDHWKLQWSWTSNSCKLLGRISYMLRLVISSVTSSVLFIRKYNGSPSRLKEVNSWRSLISPRSYAHSSSSPLICKTSREDLCGYRASM